MKSEAEEKGKSESDEGEYELHDVVDKNEEIAYIFQTAGRREWVVSQNPQLLTTINCT